MKIIRPFICGAVILASALFSSAAAADRYLLIVETTKGMKRELPAVQQCVRELLGSGMSKQLKPGDTLGIWTYNDELHAGDFPMQVWESSATAEISKRVDDFLGKQRCQNEARISQALAAMLQVIADSDRITVLIFSDGFEPVQGTPFDEVINRVFAQHREELRNVRIPFVTVVQAVGGKIIQCTINSASGPINIPALPKPAPAVVTPKPAPLAPAPVIIRTNAPLILDYSKPASNAVRPAPPATPAVAVVVKEIPKPAPAPAITAVVTASPPTVARAEVPPVVEPASPVPAIMPAALNTLPSKPAAVVSEPATAPAIVPPVVAAAIPADDVAGWVWLAVGLASAGLVGWLVWRSRSKPQVSAITESIERGKR